VKFLPRKEKMFLVLGPLTRSIKKPEKTSGFLIFLTGKFKFSTLIGYASLLLTNWLIYAKIAYY
jgi:hypothetical protein